MKLICAITGICFSAVLFTGIGLAADPADGRKVCEGAYRHR
jgi:hypothetical protein